MLFDYIDNLFWKVKLMGFFNTVSNMRPYYRNRKFWRKVIMLVYSIVLIFSKIFRLIDFSNIVIISSDSGYKTVCANFTTRGFCKLSNHKRMLISSRSKHEHSSQKRRI